jgi:tetratricopeptide (TPR) repeat protein
MDSEPADTRRPTDEELRQLGTDVRDHPDDRARRLALVRALVRARQLDEALVQATDWRTHDAYNLVAVRALGDVYMERGQRADAERVYSAIVELLPRDPDAQRAVATLLKQRGDLEGARERLAAAVDSRPSDPRLLFELADVELRLGHAEEAAQRLERVVTSNDTPAQIRYPAEQRLGQIRGTGAQNDIHVYLSWDTDRTDVDLWVITPHGEKVFYGHRRGKAGEALFDDVTTGYGPESFTATSAQVGEYRVLVNYFSAGRTAFPEARGEVVVVLDEGRPGEKKHALPYRLFAEKQTVTVARIVVGGGT